MSLPVTAGAAALTLARTEPAALHRLAGPLAVGVPAAALAGLGAARWQSRRRGAQALVTWALYRLALATVLAVALRRRGGPPDPLPEEHS